MEWIPFDGVWKCEIIKHIRPYTSMADLYFETTGIHIDTRDSEGYEAYRTWMLTHPKFLENLDTTAAFQKAVVESEAKSFVGLGLNKPGVLLKVNGRTILLGHTNVDGVDEGCCTSEILSSHDIVTEYAILIVF